MKRHHGVSALAILAAISGCSDDKNPSRSDSSLPTVEISSPEIPVQSGQETTYCYYFRMPTTDDLFMWQWQASFTPGVLRVALFGTGVEIEPPGTLSAASCALLKASGPTSTPSSWLFSGTHDGAEYQFPSDDGTGKPVGLSIPAGQPAYLWMHVFNPTTETIQVNVTIHGTAYALGTAVTRAESYVMMDGNLVIPPMSTGTFERTGPIPAADSKFASLTTHTNHLSDRTRARVDARVDGVLTTLVETTDWANPGTTFFGGLGLFTPSDGMLTHRCDYDNQTNRTVTTGDSVVDDEQCIALAYYFPADRPRLCYNGILIP